ncbi:hypothetical protein A4X03_0g97 [Tilletia caries]|uniref:Transcription factor domain-containing protein n=1 Tax=Tilletia caries TaxID=13290 RepID=A0A177VG80_9BASI|nr:hypothetical protein A4X03_0g97 [Tilletia caries]
MKCSGEQPWCKTCRDRSQPCVYEPNAGKALPAKRKFPAAFCSTQADELQACLPIGNPPSSASSLSSMSTLTSASSSDNDHVEWFSTSTTQALPPSSLPDMPHFSLQDVPAGTGKRAASTANKKRAKGRGKAKATFANSAASATAHSGAIPDQISNPTVLESVGAHLIQLFNKYWCSDSLLQRSLQSPETGPSENSESVPSSLQAMLSDLVEMICRDLSPLGSVRMSARETSHRCRTLLAADQDSHIFDPKLAADIPSPVEARDAHWFSQLLTNVFETQPLLSLVVSKTIFLNDYGNRSEDKLLLTVIMAEALATQTAETAASLSFGSELPKARVFQDSAETMLATRKTDSESAFVTVQALVLLAFRAIQDGHIKRATCLFALCQKTTMWLLQDRQEHPATTILVNGIALAELEDELLRNIYWLSRTASQWILLHLGVGLSSELMTSEADRISVIPTLPPLRPSQSVVRLLDEVSGSFRGLKIHAASVAHIHVLAHLSEMISLLNTKLRPGGVQHPGRLGGISTERIAAEFPLALTDAIASLDPIFERTNPYSQLPHALRAIIVHLCLPSVRIGTSPIPAGAVNPGIQALNHLLKVTVTALTQVASCLNGTEQEGTSAEGTTAIESPDSMLLELGFPSKHLGRAAPAIVHMFGAAARALEVVLRQCGLTQATGVLSVDIHAQFRLSPEASTFVVERKGQVLYLLQQMHGFLKHDALSCGSRRTVKRHVKMLAASLQAQAGAPIAIGSIVAASSAPPTQTPPVSSATAAGIFADATLPKQEREGGSTSSAAGPVPTALPAYMRPSTAISSIETDGSCESVLISQEGGQSTPVFNFTVPSQARSPPQTPIGATLAFTVGDMSGPETPPANMYSMPRRGSHEPTSMPNLWSSPTGDSSLGMLVSQVAPSSASSSSLPTTPWSSMDHWHTPIGPSSSHVAYPMFQTPTPYSYLPAAFSHRPYTSMGPLHALGGWETAPDSIPMSVPATAPASMGWTTTGSPVSSDPMLDTSEPQNYLPLCMDESQAEEMLPCFAPLSS